jgi:hypothetical protein
VCKRSSTVQAVRRARKETEAVLIRGRNTKKHRTLRYGCAGSLCATVVQAVSALAPHTHLRRAAACATRAAATRRGCVRGWRGRRRRRAGT